ncbi:MAG: ectonucleotide pyrophosphatase/phosphodiesterase [Sphaerochaetaceae bacterium]
MKQNRLVIVSYDAMVYEDLDLLTDKPCFGKLWKEGSRVNRMQSIYPSLTYPAHTSILTGVNPGKHGIVNNEPSIPGNLKCDWYWFHDPVRVEDLHDVAKKAGLSTASVFWPVTGAHKNIDYLVAEYWAQGKGDTLEAAYKRAGTSDELFDRLVRPLIPKLDSWESPVTDEGKILLACDMIKTYQPHLLTLHLGQIDYYRHRYGVYNDKVANGVIQSERYLQMLFDACAEAGVLEETNFVVLSDHGQINYSRKMNFNALFRSEGLITTGKDDTFIDWSAWAKSANYCAQIHLKDPSDKQLYKKVFSLLKQWQNAGDMGIGEVYTAEQARERFGLYGDFSFVVESDETTLFFSDWKEPLFSDAEKLLPGYQRASHGHDPDVGPQPVFLAYGPAFRSGVILKTGRLIDEAPTFAHILGLELPEAQGSVMTQLLR